jgi:hypothetical protein
MEVGDVEQNQAGLQKAAALVVELYGQGAVQYASARAVLLEKQGDAMGAAAWHRVLSVIEDLLRTS